MKYSDLKKLTKTELDRKLKELKIELIKVNVSKAGGKANQIKKIIARINTLNNLNKENKK